MSPLTIFFLLVLVAIAALPGACDAFTRPAAVSELGGASDSVPPTRAGQDSVTGSSPPFVLLSNISLNSSTQSIAVFGSILVYVPPVDDYTGLLYAIDLSTSTRLPPLNVSQGASAFPAMPSPPSAAQVRVDNKGRLHLVDFRNAAIICLTTAGVWQSVVNGVGEDGIWSFDISPDGETYFVNLGFNGIIQSYQRSTGQPLPFKHQPTSSSVAYGPDGTIYLANTNNFPNASIDIITADGTVLSTIDLSAFADYKLDISALVVDANSNIIFTNRQGSNFNDLCVYFPASSSLSCWNGVAGYDFGLAYDAATGWVTCIRGSDDGALYTFAAPVEAAMEQTTVSLALNDGNSSTGGGGGGGLPTPYGCNVSDPELPFVLLSDVSLNASTESIAIFDSTLYYTLSYTQQYANFTSFVYAIDLLTLESLPPINVSAGAAAFPPLPYPVSVVQVRADDTGKLHLVDLRNAAIICMTAAGVWQSVVSGVGAGGLWSFDISPDGETYFVNPTTGYILSYKRSTGQQLPFKHQPTSSSVAYGPDGTIYLANGNYMPNSSIDIITADGTVLSTIDLSAFAEYKLDISGMVVDADNTIIFTNRQGTGCNDLCVYFPASGSLSCWAGAAGYDFGLAYDSASGRVTCLRGWDDGALFTFEAPVEAAREQTTVAAE